MRLEIITPLSIIVDEEIESLRAEDDSGSFGILPGHAPFLTALSISIVSWRVADKDRFCAVRKGVMTVSGKTNVAIATREAVTGDDLSTLDEEVLLRFQSEADEERVEHVEAMRLQMHAIRQMITRLGATANKESFR
ncbi:F0F1 ATP synthase subunit epsilon [Thalassospira alkalitolerans]|uniref:F0F1 ATP synthase subunit epsilon n=1 Tax=Thalassospira alkalitolerans TaxID=1293890 RepID=UPI0030EC04E6|tara:strand:- start:8055 stop:8465 length:411 start_codon:yes stop_codon:yes gene_type:complete